LIFLKKSSENSGSTQRKQKEDLWLAVLKHKNRTELFDSAIPFFCSGLKSKEKQWHQGILFIPA
jgi:hypothetical protein